MRVQPAALLKTTLPLGLDRLDEFDSGRYHSIWLPDHMVSFWPDSIWTPEFTDLATVSPSPHRHLDALAMAGSVAALTSNAPIVTSVVDTIRRHPVMLAQTALTLDHLSGGRFVLGLGSGETANTVPYGFDNSRPASRFAESLEVITRLWATDGPVDFAGEFYRLDGARLDVEPYEGRRPGIWGACAGPRMLEVAGKYVDGWFSAGANTPDEYAWQLTRLRESADRAGRDPEAIVPANIMRCLIGTDDEVARMLEAPMIKSMLLMVGAGELRARGFDHPMGDDWGGYQDINPATLPRERIVELCERADPDAIRAVIPCGSPDNVAQVVKAFCDAGLRVFRVNNWAGMAGLDFAADSAANVRATEDRVLELWKGQLT